MATENDAKYRTVTQIRERESNDTQGYMHDDVNIDIMVINIDVILHIWGIIPSNFIQINIIYLSCL